MIIKNLNWTHIQIYKYMHIYIPEVVRKIFPGFRSRCKIFLSCVCLMARAIWTNNCRTSISLINLPLRLFMNCSRSPPSANSITMNNLDAPEWDTNDSQNETIFGWFKRARRLASWCVYIFSNGYESWYLHIYEYTYMYYTYTYIYMNIRIYIYVYTCCVCLASFCDKWPIEISLMMHLLPSFLPWFD